ncbi:MAG: NAD(P)-dependent oxidoreductase [Actinomycetaceae bacterium]|nr:NAD(P)-dependent oxidoreductase [Actinomycetaceae bacterium]MDU0969929.1 NAD(P)-dependent oxidoreductase [Actinomycetaceae bacterium]
MHIGFLGTGRMGTELVSRLIGAGHTVTVWNRTGERTAAAARAGATVADTPADAIADADLVMTCLFGPATVTEVVLEGDWMPEGAVWADITTISPDDAAREDAWAQGRGVRFVHTPVVGTLAPARAGTLGVYVGGTDAQARSLVSKAVAAYADPQRLVEVDTPAEAATAKLLANLALVTTAQGVAEALRLGTSQGLSAERVLDLLDKTSLAWMAQFKRDFALGRDTADAQFTTNAIAKDAGLMLHSSALPLPATTAGLEALIAVQRDGRGEDDFSAMIAAENPALKK